MDPTNWAEKAHYLMDLAHHFPHLQLLNLGGGFGVPKKPDESRLIWKPFAGRFKSFWRIVSRCGVMGGA